jgi:hypothetical protein
VRGTQWTHVVVGIVYMLAYLWRVRGAGTVAGRGVAWRFWKRRWGFALRNLGSEVDKQSADEQICAFSLAAYAMMRLLIVGNDRLQSIFVSDFGCGTARHSGDGTEH